MRCGCAWCARRIARARFALGDLDAFVARAPGLRRRADRRRRARTTASASSRPARTSRCSPTASCAIAARRCWRWSATRDGARGDRRRPTCRSAGSRRRRCAQPAAALARRRGGAARALAGQRAVPRPRACAAMSTRRSPQRRSRAPRPVRDRLRRARLHRARGRLRAAGRRPHRARHVFACTQTPYMDRDETRPRCSACSPSQVRIVPTACGGGFGGKLDLSVQPLLVAAALRSSAGRCAASTRGPSRWLSTTKRHPARMQRHARPPMRDGTLLAFDFDGDFDTGAYASWGPTVANRVPVHASGPYRVPHVRALTRARVTPTMPIGGAFRGFGVPQAAHRARGADGRCWPSSCGIDRLEFRSRNALRAGDATATGQVLSASVGLRALPRGAAARAGDAARAEARRSTRGRRGRRGAAASASPACGTASAIPSISNPSTHAVGLRRDGARHALQRRGRHRPGHQHDHDADRRRRARRAGGAVRPGDGRHRPDAPTPARPRRRARPSCRAMPRALARRRTCARSCWRCARMPARRGALELDGGALRRCATGGDARAVELAQLAGRRATATWPSGSGTSIRRPRRSMPTARACPTPPTASPRRSPRSRSTSSSAP